jgi:hypothetical protein
LQPVSYPGRVLPLTVRRRVEADIIAVVN